MTKKTILLIAILMATIAYGQLPTTEWIDFAETDWYSENQDTFEIATAEQLAGLSVLVADGNNFADKTILITANMNLDDHLWQPIGVKNDFTFNGNVDGNNHTLFGLIVNRPEKDFAGLFGFTLESTIENLHLDSPIVYGLQSVGALVGNFSTSGYMENCTVTNGFVQCGSGMSGGIGGGIAGGLLTGSTVKKCSFSGEVHGGSQIGGLVGTAWNESLIEESYSEGLVSGENSVGGLVGMTTMSFPPNPSIKNAVKNSYSRANVIADGVRAGGLYGSPETTGDIENCYSTGTVVAFDDFGGSIGFIQTDTRVANTYWDTESSGLNEGVGIIMGGGDIEVIGKTTAEMKTQTMVDLLNNAQGNIWTLDPDLNDGYPVLSNDNANNDCSQGDDSNDFETGVNISLDFPMDAADDFFVSSGNTLNIRSIELNIMGDAEIDAVDFTFYDDADGVPGDVVQTLMGATPYGQVQTGTASGFNTYSLYIETDLNFTEGHYWMQPRVHSISANTWWEVTSIGTHGEPVALRDEGDSWISMDPLQAVFKIHCEVVDVPDPVDIPCEYDVVFDVEPISLVDIADVSNSSNPAINGSPALEDFTDIEIHVEAGETYEIVLEGNTGGPYSSYFTVFVKWNESEFWNDFSIFQIGSIFDSNGQDGKQTTGTITIPEGTPNGSYTLRVVKGFDSSPVNPCGQYGYGQAEDYTLVVGTLGVSDIESTDFTFYPNPVSNQLNISAKSSIEYIELYNMLGQRVLEKEINLSSSQVNVEQLSAGVYILKVSINGAVSSYKIIKKN